MSTENNNPSVIRITVAVILAEVGVAFLSRLPQLLPGQQEIPWYKSGFFLVGLAIVVFALLILIVPPAFWKRIWRWVKGLSRRGYTAYVWWLRCGLRYKIYGPIFESKVSKLGPRNYEEIITASIWIWIKTKNKPLKVSLNWLNVCLEQEIGFEQQKWRYKLERNSTDKGFPEITLKPVDGWWHEQTIVSKTISGDNPDYFPNIQKKFRCGVWGISVALPKVFVRELHKGANCQPISDQSSRGLL